MLKVDVTVLRNGYDVVYEAWVDMPYQNLTVQEKKAYIEALFKDCLDVLTKGGYLTNRSD